MSASASNSNVLKGKLLFPFIAPPNGGKGTQTRILSERYGLPTFDMGATFRAIMKEGADPQLAEELNSYMSQGRLVPIETVMKVFTKGFLELAEKHPKAKGFILDGFPRSLEQASALQELVKSFGAQIGTVVYLNVSIPVVEKRSTGRRFCSQDAGHVYNIYEPKFQPREDNRCDIDGAELIIRPDDEPETVKKRLLEYQKETDPIIDFFKKAGLLVEINGEQQPELVTAEIEKDLKPMLALIPAS
ncbi:MAG: nucleoside monophosphate kinase [Vampirovibrionales bacterium]|nr:nucleoside monophosphate kinase [Vampirovibrionales bacterium]